MDWRFELDFKKNIMNSELFDYWQKFEVLSFHYDEDKKIFNDFLIFLKTNFPNHWKEIKEFLDYYLMKYSSFDQRVLFNPIELYDAILEKDFYGKNIDSDEVEKIISNFHDYFLYFSWKMEKKEFLEKKYEIQIIFIEEDVYSVWSGIFGKQIATTLNKIHIIQKLEKLLLFYPISFIKNIQLDSIIIAQSFYKKDVYGKDIMLWWFETDSDNNIYVTLSNLQRVFDHELYHQAMQYYNDRNEWSLLRKKQNLFYLYSEIDDIVKWFARNYWKENISEDQATIAEEFINNYIFILERCKKDTILEKKVQLVKKAFLFLSDGIMNENFWQEYYINK